MSAEFEDFLSDVTSVVQQHVSSWQARLSEAVAFWRHRGFRTAVLERALALTQEPDVAGLLATFSAAAEHLGALERTACTVDPSLADHPLFRDPERVTAAEDLVERALAGETPPSGPDATLTFDVFETGVSNQLALHAANQVLAQPGGTYNPLVVHGPSGVGKSHLLHALGNALAHRSNGPLVVAAVAAPRYVDELIEAVKAGTVERWRARFRSVGALVMDDVQLLAGRKRTQEEFLLLFSALVGARKPVVLSSDRAPGDIPDLDPRLRSRFEGGIVVPIQPPDYPMRERLVARHLAAAGRDANPPLIAALAALAVQSAREIAGTVNRLGAAADAAGCLLTEPFVRSALGQERVPVAPAVRRSAPTVAAPDATFVDAEKVVWEWPDIGARLMEDLR